MWQCLVLKALSCLSIIIPINRNHRTPLGNRIAICMCIEDSVYFIAKDDLQEF